MCNWWLLGGSVFFKNAAPEELPLLQEMAPCHAMHIQIALKRLGALKKRPQKNEIGRKSGEEIGEELEKRI